HLHHSYVDELRRRLNEQAEVILTEEDFIPITAVDAFCKVEDVTLAAIEDMQKLAPFPLPSDVLRSVAITLYNLTSLQTNR
ncbi:hypothetical protein ACT453_56160, partial [Bacillus sp. D-CC]